MSLCLWIMGTKEDRGRLESMGVLVGRYDPIMQAFRECVVNDAALEKLQPTWGDFVWGPEERKGRDAPASNAYVGR